MKTDTVFKKAFNDALDLVSKLKHCEPLPSENVLGARLGVSRTTVRKVLSKFSEAGLIAGSGAQRTVRLTHPQMQRFPDAETIPMANQVERLFMEWTLRDNMSPGALINELDLARRFGVATTSIREFLKSVSIASDSSRSGQMRVGCSKASPPALRWSCSRYARCSSCGRRRRSPPCPPPPRFGRSLRCCARST